MLRKACLGVLVLAGALTAIPMEEAMGGPNTNLPLQTVYTCTIIRAGTVQRPIIYTFNTDGTFNYSSATTINSLVAGPVHDSGFHGRGGGRGQWTRTSINTINYKSVEFLYDGNSSLAGSFAVDANLLITPTGQLCGGRAAGDSLGTATCPNQ